MSSSFSKFDSKFQRHVLALMFRDPVFRKLCADVIEPDSFDGRIDADYAKIFLDFHEKYPEDGISKEVVYNEIKTLKERKKIGETDLADYVKAFVEIMTPLESPGYTRDQMLGFAKQKAVEAELVNTAGLLSKGRSENVSERFAEIERKFDGKAGVMEDWKIAGSAKSRVEALKGSDDLSKRDGIPTGMDGLDESLYRGGVGRKEMMVVCGSPGRGKSIFLVNISAAALIKGYDVLFYTLEVSNEIVLNRFDSCLTGVPFVHLSSLASMVEDRWNAISMRPIGEIYLRDLPPRYLTPNRIRTDLRHYESEGVKIDAVAVDYADIMASDKRIDERRLEHGDIYEQLRGIAKEFNVAMFTASQANRDSLRKAEVDIDSMSEDFSKAMTADYVIGLSQTKSEEKEKTRDGRGTGAMRLFVAKNRNGVKGKAVPVMTDFNCMRFSIHDWDEYDVMLYGRPAHRLAA
jgi:replicative DNA helicase